MEVIQDQETGHWTILVDGFVYGLCETRDEAEEQARQFALGKFGFPREERWCCAYVKCGASSFGYVGRSRELITPRAGEIRSHVSLTHAYEFVSECVTQGTSIRRKCNGYRIEFSPITEIIVQYKALLPLYDEMGLARLRVFLVTRREAALRHIALSPVSP